MSNGLGYRRPVNLPEALARMGIDIGIMPLRVSKHTSELALKNVRSTPAEWVCIIRDNPRRY